MSKNTQSDNKEKIIDIFTKAKQKYLKTTSIILVAGGLITAGLNWKLPNCWFSIINDKTSYCTTIDFNELEQNNFCDPIGERFIVKKEETPNYIETSKMVLNDNTIRISYEEDLSSDYIESVQKSYELYKKIFSVINPKIKVELGNFDMKDCNIFVRKLKPEEENKNSAMDANMLFYGYNGTLKRVENATKISIYNSTDQEKQYYKNIAMAHEFAHAIFGLDDYRKADDHLISFGIKNQPATIMNSNFINKINSVSMDPKVTTFDLALFVKQYGLFQDNEYKEDSKNYFKDKESYYNHINSNLSNICYNEMEMNISQDIEAQ